MKVLIYYEFEIKIVVQYKCPSIFSYKVFLIVFKHFRAMFYFIWVWNSNQRSSKHSTTHEPC